MMVEQNKIHKYEVTRSRLTEHSIRYQIMQNSTRMSYAEVLEGWLQGAEFRQFFLDILAGEAFGAFRWETPPVTRDTVECPFEFVLHDAPWLLSEPDARTYRAYFSEDDTDEGVVVFDNLGGDARLVTPSPRTGHAVYVHLAAFVRGSPRRPCGNNSRIAHCGSARQVAELPGFT